MRAYYRRAGAECLELPYIHACVASASRNVKETRSALLMLSLFFHQSGSLVLRSSSSHLRPRIYFVKSRDNFSNIFNVQYLHNKLVPSVPTTGMIMLSAYIRATRQTPSARSRWFRWKQTHSWEHASHRRQILNDEKFPHGMGP